MNKHIIPIVAFLLISIFFLHERLSFTELPLRDAALGYFPPFTVHRISVHKYGDLIPLWHPFGFSGAPFLMKPESSFLSLLYIFAAIFPVIFALNILNIIAVFLAGLFMYIFMYYLLKNRYAAFISGLIFMLSGYVVRKITENALSTLITYAFPPLIFYLLLNALKTKQWVKYAILTGIILGLQIHNDTGLKVFLWSSISIGILLFIHIIGEKWKQKLIKTSLIVIIFGAIMFGLAAERLIPVSSFLSVTGRSEMKYEDSASRAVKPNQLFNYLIEPIYEGMPKIQRYGGYGFHIGIIAALLSMVAIIKKWKNKIVLWLVATAIFSILIATGTPLFYLLWKYVPPFGSFRYLPRALCIFAFAGAALAGYGFDIIHQKIKKKSIFFGVVAVLIILNLWVFNYSPFSYPKGNVMESIASNQILQDLSKKPELFRIEAWEQRGIDYGPDVYVVPLELEHIYSYNPVWVVDYLNIFLTYANMQPAKWWGLLNVKYVTSQTELNEPGFKFIKKYENCTKCFPEKPQLAHHYGPYLYENELALPRAFVVNDAVLVIGKKEVSVDPESRILSEKLKILYEMMLLENWDYSKTAVISGKDKVSDYTLSELLRYRVLVLLSDSVDETSVPLLMAYKEQGGILFPDIFDPDYVADADALNSILGHPPSAIHIPINDSNIIMHNFDKREIKLNRQHKGRFLVYSEKFSLFEGWKARGDGKELELPTADITISAIYLDDEYNSIIFTYLPKPYVIGFTITALTILMVIFYFIGSWYRNYTKKIKDNIKIEGDKK